jgi:hypothetical protein
MRALTVEELGFVSGGFGFNGPPPAPVETVVVPGQRKKKPDGMTHDTFMQMMEMRNDARNLEMFCNMTRTLQYRLEDKGESAEDLSLGLAVVGVGVGTAVAVGSGGTAAPIGGAIIVVSGVGGVVGQLIGDRYTDDARALSRERDLMGC